MLSRRSFIRNSAFTIGALTLHHQQLLASIAGNPLKITMLRNNVGVYTERGGTIAFLLNKAGTIVVDAQFPDSVAPLITELKNRSDKPFLYLINTHHHGDHTSGNINFKDVVNHVVAHQNSAVNQKAAAERNNSIDKQLFPSLTYTSSWKAKLPKEKIRIHYFGPGHTNGDSIIHFQKANVVHMGDLMFNRRHPFVDRTAGASIQNWTEVLQKAFKTFEKDTIFVFGHAAAGHEVTGTREDLLKFRDYLNRVLDFARQEIRKGVTKEDFIKNKTIPGETEWQGDGIERPLTAAYEELSAQ